MTSGSLGVATLTPQRPAMGMVIDTRSWLAVKASDLGASLTGLEGILEGQLTEVGLKLNQASGFENSTTMTGAPPVLDWTSVAIDTNGDGSADADVVDPSAALPTGAMAGDLDITGDADFSGKLFKVNGTLDNLNILGLVSGSASFGLKIQEVDVDLTNGDTDGMGTPFDDTGDLQNAQLLQFGLDVTSVTVGCRRHRRGNRLGIAGCRHSDTGRARYGTARRHS